MLHKFPDAPVLSLFSLKGKTALITGGARGIGLAVATGMAEAGANVAITYNSTTEEEIEQLKSKFQELNVKFKAYKCNVVDQHAIAQCVDQIYKDFGSVDVVVPNAGITIYTPAEEFSAEDFRKTLTVNLDGAFFTAQAAANVFKLQKKENPSFDQGRIVFTASVSSSIVNIPQQQAPYNASKAGLVQMAKCLAVEWVDFARVNCVSPGFIETDMINGQPESYKKTWFLLIPGGRLCAPHELKGVYVFLASAASSYVTGEEVFVSGGYTLT